MELTRRQFLTRCAVALAAAGAGALSMARRADPRRVVRALRGLRFPGQLRERSEQSIRRPGRWAG
mgnify:CR=1 FL=1